MLKTNVIRKSTSPWSSRVVLVKKKDGKLRFSIDYRGLNKLTKKDVYPLPRIDYPLAILQKGKYFSTLDLFVGLIHWKRMQKRKQLLLLIAGYTSLTLCHSVCAIHQLLFNDSWILQWQYIWTILSCSHLHLRNIWLMLKKFLSGYKKLMLL